MAVLGALKTQDCKIRNWKTRLKTAGLEKGDWKRRGRTAGLENARLENARTDWSWKAEQA